MQTSGTPPPLLVRFAAQLLAGRERGQDTQWHAPLMDRSTGSRQKIMTFAVGTDYSAETLAADDALLEAHLRPRVNGTWHPCGSCRMGDPSDRLAMTDPNARVIGVEGLRVCDASLMPTVPCANRNIPVLMIAEKTAAAIRAGG